MLAVMMWVRAEIRERWRAWLGLAVVIGMFGGVVLACAAGARRTESSYRRFLVAQNQPDAITFSAAFDPSFAVFDPDEVEALPSIEDSVRATYFEVNGPYDAFASADLRFGRSFPRLRILEGRMPDPDAADEAAVPVALVSALGARVGGMITLPFSEGAGPPEPPGPTREMTFRVVAIFSDPGSFPPRADSDPPLIMLTPAFHRAHHGSLSGFETGFHRLVGGERGLDQLRSELEGLAGGKPWFVMTQAERTPIAQDAVGLIAGALWLLGTALAVVAVLVVGQALARQTFLESRSLPIGRALGATSSQLAAVGIVRAAIIGVVAAIISVAVAIVLSPLAPVGVARIVEPYPGIAIDGLVLGIGSLAVVIVVTVLSILPAVRAERLVVRADTGPQRPSRLARVAWLASMPVTAVAGMRLALERGRGRTAVPVRSSLGGAALGVAALVVAFSFGASLDRLLETPRLYGVLWDAEVEWQIGDDRTGAAIAEGARTIRALPEVAHAAAVDSAIPFVVDGVPAPGVAFAAADRILGTPIERGRLPANDREIVLGRRTLERIGKRLQDEVQVSVGGLPELPFTIVGTAAMPGFEESSSVGEGSVLVPEAVGRWFPDGGGPPVSGIFVKFRPNQDARAAIARLEQLEGLESVRPASVPGDLQNLRLVRTIPGVMAAILALLSAATLGHALTSVVRRRRRDLAIFKAIGFDRANLRAVVAWQAATLAVAALVAGLVAGVIAGRALWRVLAGSIGVLSEPALPVAAIAIVIPAAIALAVALSAIPARTASRVRSGEVLRAE